MSQPLQKKKAAKVKTRFRGLGELCCWLDKLALHTQYYPRPLILDQGIVSDKDWFPIYLVISQEIADLYNGNVVYVKKIPYLLSIHRSRYDSSHLELTPI